LDCQIGRQTEIDLHHAGDYSACQTAPLPTLETLLLGCGVPVVIRYRASAFRVETCEHQHVINVRQQHVEEIMPLPTPWLRSYIPEIQVFTSHHREVAEIVVEVPVALWVRATKCLLF